MPNYETNQLKTDITRLIYAPRLSLSDKLLNVFVLFLFACLVCMVGRFIIHIN